MTEKDYAHLSPNYVAERVRAALPSLGIVDKTNLTPPWPLEGRNV